MNSLLILLFKKFKISILHYAISLPWAEQK